MLSRSSILSATKRRIEDEMTAAFVAVARGDKAAIAALDAACARWEMIEKEASRPWTTK